MPAAVSAPPAAVLAKAGRENFPVASRLLPRRLREPLLAIYGYARLVDDAGDLAPGDREALLDRIEADLDRAYEGRAEHPLIGAVAAHGLPKEPCLRLLAANRQDQRVSRYETFEELRGYCHLSADPVGELVLHVLDAATPERIGRSDAVCTALQLAEHWQDVAEDYAMGRVYLPREDLARFGVAEEELAEPRATEALRRLLSFEVERARGLLAEGVPLVASLSGFGRLAVAGYVGGGRAALDAIERAGFDPLAGTPRATRAARARAIAAVLREAGR